MHMVAICHSRLSHLVLIVLQYSCCASSRFNPARSPGRRQEQRSTCFQLADVRSGHAQDIIRDLRSSGAQDLMSLCPGEQRQHAGEEQSAHEQDSNANCCHVAVKLAVSIFDEVVE